MFGTVLQHERHTTCLDALKKIRRLNFGSLPPMDGRVELHWSEHTAKRDAGKKKQKAGRGSKEPRSLTSASFVWLQKGGGVE